MSFPAALRIEIAAAGLRQCDVAAHLGTSQGLVSNWLHGRRKVPVARIRELKGLLSAEARVRLEEEWWSQNQHDPAMS